MPETKTISPQTINLIDESYDLSKSDAYHLSVLCRENGFGFSVLDTNTNKYLVLQSNAQLPVSSFKSVNCCVANSRFTAVPSALFDEENKKSLLGFNHEVKEGEEIIFNTLHNLDAKILFAVPKQLVSEIRNQFPNADFIHSSASFMEGLLVQNKNNIGKKVFANFYSGYFEIVILDGRELLFCNAFNFKTSEDIAYYVLFVYEQLQLNPEIIELVLSGEIDKTTKGYSLLYTYIKNVKFASRPDGFKYSYKFEEVPSHKFWILFTQYLITL